MQQLSHNLVSIQTSSKEKIWGNQSVSPWSVLCPVLGRLKNGSNFALSYNTHHGIQAIMHKLHTIYIYIAQCTLDTAHWAACTAHMIAQT